MEEGPGPYRRLDGLEGGGVAGGAKAAGLIKRAPAHLALLTEARLLGRTYQALIETYRRLCAERRKILEDLIQWMDEHGGIPRPRPGTANGSETAAIE